LFHSGLCIHALTTVSSQPSIWSPPSLIERLREKFIGLSRSGQTFIMVLLILSLCLSGLCLLAAFIRYTSAAGFRFLFKQKQSNKGYVMLETADHRDADDQDSI
jgi:hypothetical protein